MSNEVMVCGVDCKKLGENCNGYCYGKTDHPPPATPEMLLSRKREKAYAALREAEKAWYAYFGECEVGREKEQAAEVYERIRTARRL